MRLVEQEKSVLKNREPRRKVSIHPYVSHVYSGAEELLIRIHRGGKPPCQASRIIFFTTLASSWTTTTKEWMEPGKPPMESNGTAEMKMLLDGRFLYQEFNGQMMGQPFNGIGIDAYDNMTKKYMTAWMDSMGTGIFLMEGTASPDGKTITLRGSHPEPGGGKMTHRAIWKIVDANNQTFDMYGAHHGQKETKMMEITYTRKQ